MYSQGPAGASAASRSGRLRDDAGKGVESRHLRGAGGLQIPPRQRKALFIQIAAARGHDTFDITLGFHLRIDPVDAKAWQRIPPASSPDARPGRSYSDEPGGPAPPGRSRRRRRLRERQGRIVIVSPRPRNTFWTCADGPPSERPRCQKSAPFI